MRAGRAGIGLERGGIPVREVPDTIAGVAGPSVPVSLADVESAARRLDGVAVRTPLLRLPLEGEVYVKPESLQRTGSFKFRGAFNALAATPFHVIARGVVADSSGNHAQGVAAAASLLGVPATIVMPENAAPVKVARTRALGRRDRALRQLERRAPRVAAEIGATRSLEYIPPFDDATDHRRAGHGGARGGTDLPDVATIVVCVGGGGLISGSRPPSRRCCPGRG